MWLSYRFPKYRVISCRPPKKISQRGAWASMPPSANLFPTDQVVHLVHGNAWNWTNSGDPSTPGSKCWGIDRGPGWPLTKTTLSFLVIYQTGSQVWMGLSGVSCWGGNDWVTIDHWPFILISRAEGPIGLQTSKAFSNMFNAKDRRDLVRRHHSSDLSSLSSSPTTKQQMSKKAK